jgi:hypothetical protein
LVRIQPGALGEGTANRHVHRSLSVGDLGCIALIVAVPLTTALAATLVSRIPVVALPEDHGHGHSH